MRDSVCRRGWSKRLGLQFVVWGVVGFRFTILRPWTVQRIGSSTSFSTLSRDHVDDHGHDDGNDR